MKLAEFVLEKRSLILTIVSFFLFLGILQFLTMPREEDPRLKERFGVLRIVYPGASTDSVRRLLATPTEDSLADVPEIKTLEIRIRPEFMIAEIRLSDSLSTEEAINQAWKRCEDALKLADYPQGILKWNLDRHVTDQDAILIALTGAPVLELKENSEVLKEALLQIPTVSKVNLLADPEEEVQILFLKEKMQERGLSLRFLMDWIGFANHNIPSGTFAWNGKKAIVKTDAWFEDLQSLVELPIPLPSGSIVSLGEMAEIKKTPKSPPTSILHWKGAQGMGYGVVAKKNINLIQFGKDVEEVVAAWKEKNKAIQIEIINSQPTYVGLRLKELGLNLFFGILIVAGVLVTMMGLRLGFLSSILVPMIALVSLGIYGMFGGVLHQISIAAFVMALGLLIDNVIVVLESIQEKIDSGMELTEAVKDSIGTLAFPLLSATGTTLAAFIPMLGSSGASADFTRAIPTINMLTLTVSFFFAILVTPLLALRFLKPKPKSKESRLTEASYWIGKQIPHYAKPILLISLVLFLLSFIGLGQLPKKFFPDADRDQLLVDFRMPEGTDIGKTRELAIELEKIFSKDKRVKSVTTFIGRSTPLFYYNLNQSPNSPHIAQFIVKTNGLSDNLKLKKEWEEYFEKNLAEGYLVISELKQGPPVKAPIEIRVFSEESADRETANQMLLEHLYATEGLRVIRSDFGVGTPKLKIESDDASLGRYRMTRSELTLSVLSQTKGVGVGQYYASKKAIPIILRTMPEDKVSETAILESPLLQTRTGSLALEKISGAKISWEPSLVYRKDKKTGFSIYAEVKDGYTAEKLTSLLSQSIKSLPLPKSIQYEFGGEDSESGEANRSLLSVAPLGMVLLVAFLLVEFGTWKKVGIILLTIPLSLVGVVLGLALSGKPFGFLSLLGIFALVGIVVNNGILLLDYIGIATKEGRSLEEAITFSLGKRIRPILLTTMTTIAGLIPLAITDATLWPPFAFTMIFGLFVSTFLTLFVVPSTYYLVYREKDTTSPNLPKQKKGIPLTISRFSKKKSLFFLFVLLVSFISSGHLSAETREMDWKTTVDLAGQSPRVRIAWEEYKRKHLEKDYLDRAVYYPKLGVSVERINRDRSLVPNSAIPVVPGIFQAYWTGGVEIQQTIFDPANWFAVGKALSFSEDASKLLAERSKETAQAESLLAYLGIHKIRAKRNNLNQLKQNFSVRLVELRRLYAIGQVTESELFRIEQALSQAKIALNELEEKEKIALLNLQRLLGIDDALLIKEIPKEDDIRVSLDLELSLERPEILAMKRKMNALEAKKQGIEYEALPKLVAKGGYYYLNNNQFNTDQWGQVSIGITVNPFDGGLRSNRIEEVESEMRTTRLEWEDLIRALELEKQDAKTNLDLKRKEYETRQTLSTKAKVAAAREYKRMREGRTNINSWIDAEILSAEEKDKLDTIQLEVLEAWVKLRNVFAIPY
ncbi:efflux RND transporter permease subunit [Leptospira sp. WS60.C2]